MLCLAHTLLNKSILNTLTLSHILTTFTPSSTVEKLLFPGFILLSTLILGIALKPHNCRCWTAILISYPWNRHFAIDSDTHIGIVLNSHKFTAQQISIAPSGQLSFPWHCRNGHPIFYILSLLFNIFRQLPILGIAEMRIQYFQVTILSLAFNIFKQLSYPWHCQNGHSIFC